MTTNRNISQNWRFANVVLFNDLIFLVYCLEFHFVVHFNSVFFVHGLFIKTI